MDLWHRLCLERGVLADGTMEASAVGLTQDLYAMKAP